MATTIGSILVIEDDVPFRMSLRAVLDDANFLVAEAGTGHDAKVVLDSFAPDLILLDLGLPDVSGLDLLAELCALGIAPVIVITGRSGETDTVVGLELGADDYITKPFSERELVARIRAAIRRGNSELPVPTVVHGSLSIDLATRDVHVGDARIELTPKEFDVLAFLAQSPRRVYSRQQLLQHVWASTPDWQDDNTVGEHIHRIRRKLDPDERSQWIETVRGVGYRFAPLDAG